MYRLLTAILFALLFAGTLAANRVVGQVTFVKGRVDIVNLATSEHAQAKAGDELYENAEIRTSNRSRISILLIDTSRIEVHAFSIVNVKILTGNVNPAQIKHTPLSVRMLGGKVRVKVAKGKGRRRFFLKTPTLVAGVQGTDFACVATMEDARLLVFEGSVEVGNRSAKLPRSYMLRERQETRVQKNTEPDLPQFLSGEIIENYLDNYEITKAQSIRRRVREPNTFIDKLFRNKQR